MPDQRLGQRSEVDDSGFATAVLGSCLEQAHTPKLGRLIPGVTHIAPCRGPDHYNWG